MRHRAAQTEPGDMLKTVLQMPNGRTPHTLVTCKYPASSTPGAEARTAPHDDRVQMSTNLHTAHQRARVQKKCYLAHKHDEGGSLPHLPCPSLRISLPSPPPPGDLTCNRHVPTLCPKLVHDEALPCRHHQQGLHRARSRDAACRGIPTSPVDWPDVGPCVPRGMIPS